MNVKNVLFGLTAALVLAIFISPFASPFLDGLEKTAKDKGFLEKGEGAALGAPVPDYAWPGIQNERIATAMAGAAGVILVFTATCALAFLIRRH